MEPLLNIFDSNHETIVFTDASRDGFAGIIIQIDNKFEQVIAYLSKQTTKEKTYHPFELELLAIVKTLQRYRYCLKGGKELTVIINCHSVKSALAKQSKIP